MPKIGDLVLCYLGGTSFLYGTVEHMYYLGVLEQNMCDIRMFKPTGGVETEVRSIPEKHVIVMQEATNA